MVTSTMALVTRTMVLTTAVVSVYAGAMMCYYTTTNYEEPDYWYYQHHRLSGDSTPCAGQSAFLDASVHGMQHSPRTDAREGDVVSRFFITEDEERREFENSRRGRQPVSGSPGFTQPINVSGSGLSMLSCLDSVNAICYHLRDRGWGLSDLRAARKKNCRAGKTVRYTQVRNGETFTCGDVVDQPGRAGCAKGFDGFLPALRLEGPTFVFSRTPHFPHFLEEVADAANWLHANNASQFAHALIDDSSTNCALGFSDTYQSGQWAPSGSPMNSSIQVAMMQTVAAGIVFSFGVREKHTVCMDRPWRRPRKNVAPSNPSYFDLDARGHPSICSGFREKIRVRYGFAPQSSNNTRVLILQRDKGGRVVTNMRDLTDSARLGGLNLTLRVLALESQTASEQFREFFHADVLIAHHGAAIALAAMMAPGSLVIELFNYRATCVYYDSLCRGCGLTIKRLHNEHGNDYGAQCNGNNRKDASDNAPVDIARLSTVVRDWVAGRRAR